MSVNLSRILDFLLVIFSFILFPETKDSTLILLLIFIVFLFTFRNVQNTPLNVLLKIILVFQFIRVFLMSHDSSSYTFSYSSNWNESIALNGVFVSGILTLILIRIFNNYLVLSNVDAGKKPNNRIILLFLVLLKFIFTVFYDVGLLNSNATSLSFMDLLIPDIVLWFLIFQFKLDKSFKIILISFLLIISFMQQSKAVIFEGLLAYIIFYLIYNPKLQIKLGKIFYFVTSGLIGVYFFVILYFKRRGDSNINLQNGIDIVINIFTRRLSYIDGFVLQGSIKDTSLQEYTNIRVVGENIFAGLLPLVSSDYMSIGNAVGVIFQGVTEGYPHSASIGFFPLMLYDFQYFISVIILLGFITLTIYMFRSFVVQNKEVFNFFIVYTILILVLSGNIDRIVVNLIATIISALVFSKLISLKIRRS